MMNLNFFLLSKHKFSVLHVISTNKMMKTSSCATNVVTRWCSRGLNKNAHNSGAYLNSCNRINALRKLSSSSVPQQNGLTPEGEVVTAGKNATIVPQHEVVRFPSSVKSKSSDIAANTAKDESVPILLNSKEHAVGYLSKILNARVYDAAIETDLQEAKNLSSVRYL